MPQNYSGNQISKITKSAIILTAVVTFSFAGPLNPPAGPITSTPGPEPRIALNATNTPGDADSVYKITQPGSYYLTGNLSGVSGKRGIEIDASDVTIDLNGFEAIGGSGSLAGIWTGTAGLRSLTVRNGSLRSWGSSGIDFNTNVANNCTISNIRVSECGSGGLSGGIIAGYRALVTDCAAYSNTGRGIGVGSDSTISTCMVNGNTGDGISGTTGCTLTACTSNGNQSAGISVTSSSIINCTASSNGLNGINNSSGGVTTGCAANDNDQNGINASYGTISNCTVRMNTTNGIVVDSGSLVINNTCSSNGLSSGDGAGILATGNDNRIEGNNCLFADRGIDINGIGNIIIKNSCSGNTTNWTIVANNVYGPILDRTAPASAAVNGNSAASSLGSTDPNANFTY